MQPGELSRIVGLFSARGFNIENDLCRRYARPELGARHDRD